MTFQDIFRSSFLENVSAISMLDMALSILLSFALGLFIFFIYKKTYCGIMYSPGFGVTLIALTLITNLLILAVTSNIVRFRTAIKEPMDIAFLFWSIAAGIVLAAGFIPLAVFGSMFIGLILLIFSSRRDTEAPYILVVHCDSDEAEQKAAGLIRDRAAAAVIKSKSVSAGCIELNYEVRLKDGAASFVNELAGMEGVSHAVLVSYNGDYMG